MSLSNRRKNQRKSPLRFLQQAVLGVCVLLLGLMAALWAVAANDRADDYDVSLQGVTVPSFKEHDIDFIPAYDKERTLPFVAGAIIDIDGLGPEEIFFGGGIDDPDAFFAYENGAFVDVTARTGWVKDLPDTTYGAVSLDVDEDGDADLLVTRQSGVWLYLNDAGRFAGQRLALDFDDTAVPLSVAVGDVNQDGQYDLYVAGYIARENVEGQTIFNRPYGGTSALYINTGEHTFRNATEESGLLYQHNTFQSVFVDVDLDDRVDLVVAHDTGTIRTWRNQGDGTFANIPNPSTDYFSYPMGIGVGDVDNDGLPDFLFSNVGTTTPDVLVRGDLTDEQVLHKEWMLFRNQGGFAFEDAAKSMKVADYEFSWGAVLADLNLDGRSDAIVSENYAEFPLHLIPALRLNGRLLLQNPRGEFAAAGKLAGVRNRFFGISPLTADFNDDGYPDIVHVNLDGPQRVFVSNGGDAGYLKVQLPNQIGSVGARVAVTLASGDVLHDVFVVGEGLCSDSSHILSFGLGDERATSIEVGYLDGRRQRIEGNFVSETVVVEANEQETRS